MARDIGDLIVRMKVILALYIVYLDDVRSERLKVGCGSALRQRMEV